MKILFYTLALFFFSVSLNAQGNYQITELNPQHNQVDGFIFSGIELGKTESYVSGQELKNLRQQYNLKDGQIITLKGLDKKFHIIAPIENRNSKTLYFQLAKINKSVKRVDVFKSDADIAIATVNKTKTTASQPTLVAKGGSSTKETYQIQVAAFRNPMNDETEKQFKNKIGDLELVSRYDERSGLYKYFIDKGYHTYEMAKSEVKVITRKNNEIKPFVVKY